MHPKLGLLLHLASLYLALAIALDPQLNFLSNDISLHSGFRNDADDLRSVTASSAYGYPEEAFSVINVKDFGAVGDGVCLNTNPIQSAIDACALRGQCMVHFPPGLYLTGTIFLKSNVSLHLDPEATIVGSTERKDYPVERTRWYVIIAENASNVGISGGTVDGQGLKFVLIFDETKYVMLNWNETGTCVGNECRPRLVGFLNCKNVHIWNVKFQEPAHWCLHLVNSDSIQIHDIAINGDFNIPNNDGIDIVSSNNTIIKRCQINTGDDAICPKTIGGALYNLTVQDCYVRTKSCGVKLGSESDHDFVGLSFSNITIVDSHRGIGIQLRDSGNVRDVSFSNIEISTRFYDPSWWGNGEPIYVTACPRNSSTKVGSIYNVTFSNIMAVSENGIFLAGSKDGTLNGLKFGNIAVTLKRSTTFPGGLQDYRPGCKGLIPHQMSGVFMEYVSDIKLQNVTLSWVLEQSTTDWDMPLDFSPQTVGYVSLDHFTSIRGSISS